MPFPFSGPRLGRGAPAIAFRAAQTGGAALTVNKPAGVAVGDVVILLATASSAMGDVTTASGATWSTTSLTLGGSSEGRIWWRVLNATDVANNWNAPSNLSIFSVAYEGKGAATVTVRATNTGSGTGLTVTGFTPAFRSRGIVGVILNTGSDETAPPTNFTNRVGVGSSNNNGFAGRAMADDRLSGYAGANVTWSLAGSVTSCGFLIEVT